MNTSNNNKWQIEELGIDVLSEDKCTGKPMDLFWIWLAANIGILGIVYGALVVSFGLSFSQSILVIIIGVLSFMLVGFASFAGQKGRAPTLTLSRAIFGIKGNIAPTFFSWFTLTGWEAVNIVTGTLTLSAFFQALGIASSVPLTLISLVIFGGLAIVVSLLGQSKVLMLQSWCAKIFGTMTLIVIGYIAYAADWSKVFAMPEGSWLTSFLPALSVVAAGTGIGWTAAAADYSRYQHLNVKKHRILSAVAIGAAIPLILLMFAGVLVSVQLPDLVDAANPIGMIGTVLPTWMAVPYLLTATAGVITIAVLSLYSASLNLLTIGVKVKQSVAVTIDAVLVLGVALYVLFVSENFMGPFVSFLLFCGMFLAPWAAVFIIDYFINRAKQGYDHDLLFDEKGENSNVNVIALACWLLGAVSGLLVTNEGFIHGPFAKGIFEGSSLGVFLGFIVSGVMYYLYCCFMRCKSTSNVRR